MQQQLSPRKYIQTRARTLPIYKCFINKSWDKGRMASVFVMRRHGTGNLTVGVYLVDLMCLGVKDTFFAFNEDYDAAMERVPDHQYKEIDYPLAHNIVYAGHDFALEFDIEPNPDFSITKYILEDDTDAIPLIDVPTGDKNGKPHLMVQTPGQYSKALALLKKNAGEGNYYYTVGSSMLADDSEDEEPEEDGPTSVADFEFDTITPLDAMYLPVEDFLNEKLINSRSSTEQIALRLEFVLRGLRVTKPELFDFNDLDALPEYKIHLSGDSADKLNGPGEEDDHDGEKRGNAARRIANELMPLIEKSGKPLAKKCNELVESFREYPAGLCMMFEMLLLNEHSSGLAEVISRLQYFESRSPFARLTLALGALNEVPGVNGDYRDIYGSADISDAFPGYELFHVSELFQYWLIRMILAIKRGDVGQASRFYALIAQTEEFSFPFMDAQLGFCELIAGEMGELGL